MKRIRLCALTDAIVRWRVAYVHRLVQSIEDLGECEAHCADPCIGLAGRSRRVISIPNLPRVRTGLMHCNIIVDPPNAECIMKDRLAAVSPKSD
jgi:hypothetical protein